MSDKIYYVKSAISVSWRIGVAIAFVVAALQAPLRAAASTCPGDADGDDRVTIAELVKAVRNALDGCPETVPCSGDVDGNGAVSISELVRGVRNALDGCGAATDLIVDARWLEARLGSPDIQVVDARVGSFPGGHVPGAVPLSPYTLATTVDGVAAQIVGSAAGAVALSSIGLRSEAVVIVYGAAPEFDPARVVWALRYLGHTDVRYLDGGFAAWAAQGAPLVGGDPSAAAATDFPISLHNEIRVTGDWVLEQLGESPYTTPAIQLVDARSDSEFADGHIPTAVLVQWGRNLADGILRPADELAALYAGLDRSTTTVVYCLAGWRASVAWLVLGELGFEDVRVYDGSWLEWGDLARNFPIEVPDR